ncbi:MULTISPECIES: hypothetical protein [Photorhabdus]|uniref:hypothetical protein n=1 Tax=Photorhabdus TaxID=29487 RepID=UPI0002DB85A4|nr:hypothetical protein [Photorhabdus asymbiotica]
MTGVSESSQKSSSLKDEGYILVFFYSVAISYRHLKQDGVVISVNGWLCFYSSMIDFSH